MDLPTPHHADLTQLRAKLQEAGFTEAGLRELWGAAADDALAQNNAAPAIWELQRRRAAGQPAKPLPVLAALFVLAQPVSRGDLDAALGPDLVDALCAAGLFEVSLPAPADGNDLPEASGQEELRSVLELRPFDLPPGVPGADDPDTGTLLLFSDHGTLTSPDPVAGDFVLGLGGAGRTLAAITPRAQVAVACDLGCGCGIQALLLARHAGHVIATDVSERALQMTRLNAGLAGVTTIETRRGSMFDPLPDAVDLLVSNPPFVITPQGRTAGLTYRDGGWAGDRIVRYLLAGASETLAPGGSACFLGNWEYRSADSDDQSDSAATPAAANPLHEVTDPETSAMIIERERLNPVRYAETWIRDGGVTRATQRWDADTAAWLDDFAARGVTEIGFGWVRLHRSEQLRGPADDCEPAADADSAAPPARGATPGPVRSFTRASGPVGDNPGGLAAFLDARMGILEWLQQTGDAELAATAFRRAPDVVESRHFIPGDNAPTSIELVQRAGLAQSFSAHAALAGFVGVADGSLTLGAVAQALAQLLEVDAQALQQQLTDQVRELLPAGFVYPQV